MAPNRSDKIKAMKWFKRKAKQDAKWVNVMDAETHAVTRVPARELAPHMVECRMEGVEGTVWMDARELKQGEYQHPPFDEEVRECLREIQAAVEEFYPLSIEEWEDGFRRDKTPEREIALWLHLARTYRQLTTSRDLNAEQRRDYFGVLVTCLNSPPEHVLRVFSPNAISRGEAEEIIARFRKTRD